MRRWSHEVCSGCNGYFPTHERECDDGEWERKTLVGVHDVVEALRATPELCDPEAHEGYTGEDAANFIEREFGG